MKSVFKSFGEKQSFLFERDKSLKVINDVSFKVRAGETFGLVGESGCGKSTIAKMLVGLLQPDSGTISIDGKAIDQFTRKDLSKKIQYVFQNPVASLNPKLSIHNILSTPLKTVGGLTEDSSHKKLLEILRCSKYASIIFGNFHMNFLEDKLRGFAWQERYLHNLIYWF